MSDEATFESASRPQRKERLSPDDARFRELVQRTQSAESKYVWGLHETRFLASLSDDTEANNDLDLVELQNNWTESILTGSKKRLAELARDESNPLASIGFDEMLNEAIQNEVVRKEIQTIFPDAITEIEDQTMASSSPISARIDDLPNKLYRRILELHVAAHETKNQELQKKVPAMQERFVALLQPLIRKNGLPVSAEFLNQRIAQVRVVAGDSIGYSVSSNLFGEFNPQDDLAVISLEEINVLSNAPERMKSQDERQFHTYVHEMLHALSSRSVLGNVHQDDDSLASSRVQRLGLLVAGRFRWLNEAMTERLTLDLLNENKGSYPKERKLLESLLQQGASYTKLQRAYFEQHEPMTDKSSLIHWREMMNDFNQVFKKGYLVKLDNYIRAHGLDKATEQVQGV